ncbi:Gfo/Idh/MocA family protein [Paenibacillus sp. CMAA1364]
MLKVGLIGFGFMGHMHFDNYVRLASEGEQVQLVAICDIRIDELKKSAIVGNIATDKSEYDLTPYNLYDNVDAMLANEELDVVDICLPTYLHADLTIKMLEKGLHVFCEKPVAFDSKDGWKMVETAKRNGKTLMIGQCLRFWPAYEYLKECVVDGRYGKVKSGHFFRGSGFPQGWEDWYLDGSKSGGNIMDMHLHDTDMINWLFGMPDQVSALGRKDDSGSRYDAVSTNYIYPDGKVLNAMSDWTLQGDFGFAMTYRVNFEGGNLVFENDELKVNPSDAPGFVAELIEDRGYYREVKHFIQSINSGEQITICTPESCVNTLEIIEAELRSADNAGALEKI